MRGMVIIEESEQTLKEISKLYIHLQGEETWEKGYSCIQSNNFYIFYSQFKLLIDINEDRNLENQQLKIQKTIAIPFTYSLPDNIPGSMKREKDHKLRIDYNMSLIAETLKLDRITLKKLPIIINQYAVRQNVIKSISNSHAIRGYLNKQQGISKLECIYNGEEFSFGDQINLEMIVDLRESKQYIQEIVISLNKRTTIISEQPKVIVEQISKYSLPGVVQGIVQKINKSILLFDFHNKMEFSTTGQFIKVDYLIRIQAYSTLFNINNNDLRIDIPINLFQRLIQFPNQKFETDQIKNLYHLYDVVQLNKLNLSYKTLNNIVLIQIIQNYQLNILYKITKSEIQDEIQMTYHRQSNENKLNQILILCYNLKIILKLFQSHNNYQKLKDLLELKELSLKSIFSNYEVFQQPNQWTLLQMLIIRQTNKDIVDIDYNTLLNKSKKT